MNKPSAAPVKRVKAYGDLLRPGSEEKIPHLWAKSPLRSGPTDVSVDRIISREYHELEKERLWSKVWQFACREEHIPNVGDQYVYEICGKSFLIVRSAPDKIQAFPNSCLHRGRRLRDRNGCAKNIRCPYHAFTWRLDGTISSIPSGHEFSDLSRDSWHLPEAKVETWAGFVMINPDQGAEPLANFLGSLPDHFARWRLEERFVASHVIKLLPCNWKIAQDAFLETFHVSCSHPQSVASVADWQTQEDVFGNFARGMIPMLTPSSNVRWDPTEQDALDSMLERLADHEAVISLEEGESARSRMAMIHRERLREFLADEVDDLEETELVDLFYYTVFPNFHPWGSYNELVYRFVPNGDDHRSSVMEIYNLQPFKGERPPPAKPVTIGIDTMFSESDALVPGLARVFDQDVVNFVAIQSGLESAAARVCRLASYKESKIRNFYALHERWVG